MSTKQYKEGHNLMFIYEPLTTTNIIEIIGIIASLITSIVAIIISIKTLKQNSKMIDDSTRPYIVVYSQTANFQSPKFYIVVKNFGQIGAVVNSLQCDYDLSTCSYNKDHVPFTNFSGTFVAPGQAFITNIDPLKLFKNPIDMHFSIEYQNGNKVYSDRFTINPLANSDLIQTRAATKNQELKSISYTLQDLVEKQL